MDPDAAVAVYLPSITELNEKTGWPQVTEERYPGLYAEVARAVALRRTTQQRSVWTGAR